LGTEPAHFAGDRRDVDRFMADLITYIDLNSQNTSLTSYKTRIRLALSFMSGEVIRHWKVRMLDWVRPNQIFDEEATWDQFLAQFRAEYADTQRADRARETIDSFRMKGAAVDQYISDFI
jgi:hypothetical protein